MPLIRQGSGAWAYFAVLEAACEATVVLAALGDPSVVSSEI